MGRRRYDWVDRQWHSSQLYFRLDSVLSGMGAVEQVHQGGGPSCLLRYGPVNNPAEDWSGKVSRDLGQDDERCLAGIVPEAKGGSWRKEDFLN